MKRLLLTTLFAVVLAGALLSTQALAQPNAAPAPLPAGTASPRDPSKYWPDGKLDPTKIKGDSAILIDAKTGDVLFEKDADTKRYPASTTKIMTCLVALESGKSLDGDVTVGSLPKADFTDGAENISLKTGEVIKFEDLLAGMMIPSGNDAADAVAMYVGGSIDDFVDMMNQEAQKLGMTGTHYDDTNGLVDDSNHYTTTRDMSTLARAAVKYPEFVKLVSDSTYTMGTTNKTDKERKWTTTNYLLLNNQYGYKFATGIKTGFTSMAENSFVASAKQGDVSLISVVMHDEPRTNLWTDSVTMFEYGFQNYDTLDLQQLFSDQTFSVDVKDAASTDPNQGKLNLIMKPKSAAYITDRISVIQGLKTDPSQFQKQQTITKDTAPIQQDEAVGTVTYYYQGNPVLTCDLLAERDVEVMATPAPSIPIATASSALGNSSDPGSPSASGGAVIQQTPGSGSTIIWLAVIALLLVLAILTIRFANTQRRSRRYSHYNYRQSNGARMRK